MEFMIVGYLVVVCFSFVLYIVNIDVNKNIFFVVRSYKFVVVKEKEIIMVK